MAHADQAIDLIENVARRESLASDQEEERLEVYWQRAAQTQATLAVAVALLAVHEAIQHATRKSR
jgi:hypothetical protein